MKQRKASIQALACAALAAALAGCGGAEPVLQADSGAAQPGTAQPVGTAQMGRWLESEIDLQGQELLTPPSLQRDGSLVLYTCTAGEDGYPADPTRWTSADDGESWTQEAVRPPELTGELLQLTPAEDGTLLLWTEERGEGEARQGTCHFYLQQPGGEPAELPLDGLNPDEIYNARSVFSPQALYLAVKVMGQPVRLLCYDRAGQLTGSLTLDESLNNAPWLAAGADGSLYYLEYDESSLSLMQLDTATGQGRVMLSPLPEADSTLALTCGADGALYYPAASGIYRLAVGGTLPEQLVPGDGTAMSIGSNYPVHICRAANGDFLVCLSNTDYTLYRYHFDAALPAQASATLRVWTLRDSPTARSAVNAYKNAHPEVDVQFIIAWPEDAGDDEAARSDALTQLNTQLLAGEGPDLLLLDDTDYRNYQQQGLLADLGDAVPLDELQSNLIQPFVQDGQAYVVPARFSAPVLIGDAGSLDGLTDLAAMQRAVTDAAPRPDFGPHSADYYQPLPEEQRYALRLTSGEEFADFILPAGAAALLQGNTLDPAALEEAFTFVKTVADYYGIADYQDAESSFASMHSSTGKDPVTIRDEQEEYTTCGHARYGWFTMDTPYSITSAAASSDPLDANAALRPVDMILRPGLTAGAYTPQVLVAVNANSAALPSAKELAAAFFDPKVQGSYYMDGTTVRADCLAEKLQAVQSDSSKKAQCYTGDLTALVEGCTTPVLVPYLLRQSFAAHADAVIQGDEDVAAAVSGVQSDLALYLAEQR